MTALLSVEGVSKRFRGLQAVDAVTSTSRAGEMFAIIGPNGAGKTTLFNMIAGEIAPDAGTISFAGERHRAAFARPGLPRAGSAAPISWCGPFPALSVEDNVIIGALLRYPASMRPAPHAGEILQQLDLIDKRAQRASALTLPDRKRLEVARALATEPQLLLLDEVMAGLRPTETDRMIAILRELNRGAA